MENHDDCGMEQWSNDRLLREASKGNEKAFNVFCVRALPGLRRYVRFQCRSRDIPNDLVTDFCHQAIMRALQHIWNCREHGSRPYPKVSVAWLNQIAFNVIMDYLRESGRLTFVEDLSVEAPVELGLEEIEAHEEILKFLTWLNDNERDILEMVLVDEMEIVDAGAKLGLEKWASYKTYERALRHLRDLLQEHGILPDWAEAE